MSYEKLIEILLVEDNTGDARLIREMLAEAGNAALHINFADRLSEGLRHLAENDIDVVLLDLSLPESQGIDTLHKVQAQDSGVPIIVLTGLDDETLAVKAVQDGAQDYLVKGQVDGNLLTRSIRYAIERRRVEEKIYQQSEYLKNILESLTHPFYIIDADDYTIKLANSAALPNGITEGITCHSLTHHQDRPCNSKEHICPLQKIKETKKPIIVEHIHYFPDGSPRYVEVHGYPIIDREGNVVQIIEYSLDITGRKKSERRILESEERYRSLVESTDDSIYLVDRDYRYLFMNKKHLTRMGISDEQYTGWAYSEFHSSEETRLFIEKVDRVFKTGEFAQHEYESFRDGRYFLQTYSPVKGKDGRTESVTVVSKDITARKRMEENFRNLSITDELTGLYNRRGFFALAEQQLKIAKRLQNRIILVSADMDNLKAINDTSGHKAGDAAIMETANILKECFRESDVVARIGGDEFVVLQMVNTDIPPETFSARIQEKVGIYNAKRSGSYELSISVGVKSYSHESDCSLGEMLAQADRLMYEQKRKKKEARCKHEVNL